MRKLKFKLAFTAFIVLSILNLQAQPADARPIIKYAINNYASISKAACDTCPLLAGKPLQQFRPIPFPPVAAFNALLNVDITQVPGIAAPNFLGGGSPEIKGLVNSVAGMTETYAQRIRTSDKLYFRTGAKGVAITKSGKIMTASGTILPNERFDDQNLVRGFFSFKSTPARLPTFNSTSEQVFEQSSKQFVYADGSEFTYNMEIVHFAVDPENENIIYASLRNPEFTDAKILARKNPDNGKWEVLDWRIPGGLRESVWGPLAVDHLGNLYVADPVKHVVVKAGFDAIGKANSWKIIGGKFGTTGLNNGDNGEDTLFNKPSGICVDKAGNLYIGDAGNNVIRKIDTDGKVTIYAGNESGEAGFSDDGILTNAKFNGPTAVAYNEVTETLYAVDFNNKTIREINKNRKVSTLAGNAGSLDPREPGKFANTLYYILSQLNMDPDESKLDNPTGIAIDPSGYGMYISDGGYIKYVNSSETIFNITSAFGDPKAFVLGLPILPPGIKMNSNNGSFYGIPLVPWQPTTYGISVTNHVGISLINGFITFEVVACPEVPDTVIDNQIISLNQLPFTWNGKVLNGAGSPSVTLQSSRGCDSVVKLNLMFKPEFNYNSEPYILSYGQQIKPIVPTTAGSKIDTFSINPPLPTGLALNAQTGEISGTPLAYVTSELFPAVGPPTPPQYPAPWTLKAIWGADITQVKISDGNQKAIFANNSAFQSLVGSAGQGTGTAGAYTDFSGLGAIKMFSNVPYSMQLSNTLSSQYVLSLDQNFPTYNFMNSYAVYIDYNRDGDFDDIGERVYISAAPQRDAHAEAFNINIPGTAAAGVTKMRIYCVEASTKPSTYFFTSLTGQFSSVIRFTDQALSFYPFFNNISSNGEQAFEAYSLNYGEFEDYNIDIVNPVTQSYVINGSNPVGSAQSSIRLAVNKPSTSSSNLTICSTELPYTWNKLTFSQAGTQTAHLVNIYGADSAATLNLFIKQATSSVIVVSNCGPYTYLGQLYNTSGDYAVHVTNAAGCDSSIIFRFRQKATASVTNLNIIPTQLPYTWNGLQFTTAGTRSATLTNAEGCDSSATLVLRVLYNITYTTNNLLTLNKTITPLNPLIQGNYAPPGVWYNEYYGYSVSPALPTGLRLDPITGIISGTPTELSPLKTYTITLNQDGAQPTTITLSVGAPSVSTTTINNCGPLTWNGVVYDKAGTATYLSKNQYGYDSIATLILSIRNLSASTTNLNLTLAQLPYSWNDTSIRKEGLHTVILRNAVGCDSAATASVVISPKINYASPQILHPGQRIAAITPQSLGGRVTNYTITPSVVTGLQFDAATGTISGIPADTLLQPVTHTIQASNRAGTDTTKLVVAVCNAMATSFTMNICDRFVWNDSTYTTSTTHTRTFKNRGGCDSVVTMNLIIKKASKGPTDIITACANYVWYGVKYNTTGLYTKLYTNAVGCDSTIYLNLTIKNSTVNNLYVNLNASDFPYTWRNKTFRTPGTDSVMKVNSVGCDSTVWMTVRISDVLPDISYAINDTMLYWEKKIETPIFMTNTGTAIPAMKLGERDTLISFSNGPGDHIKTIKGLDGAYYARVFNSSKIFKLTSSGVWTEFAEAGGAVTSMAMDKLGNLYVGINAIPSYIRKITHDGVVSILGGLSYFFSIDGLAVDLDNNLIIQSQHTQNQFSLTRFNLSTNQSVETQMNNPFFDFEPEDFKTDSKGNIYMYRNVGNNIVKIKPNGHMSGIGRNTVFNDDYQRGNGIDAIIPTITSIAIDSTNDNVYIMANGRLLRVDTAENVTALTGPGRTFDQFKDQIFRVDNGKLSIVNSSTGILYTVNVYGVGSLPFMDNYGGNEFPYNGPKTDFKNFDKRIRLDSSGAIVGTPRKRQSSGNLYATNTATAYTIVAANQYGISTAPMVITNKSIINKRESFVTTSLPFLWRGRSFTAATDTARYLVPNNTDKDDTLYLLHLVYEGPPEPVITSNCATGGFTLTAAGAAKSSISFDGTNMGIIKTIEPNSNGGQLGFYNVDVINKPDGSTLVKFHSSFEVWIKPTSVNGIQYLLTKDTVKTHGTFFGYSIQDGKFVYEFTEGSSPFVDYKLSSVSNINPNVWTHVAASFYDSTMYIFINGKLEGSLKTADRFINILYYEPGSFVGIFPDFFLAGLPGRFGYKGQMDELRLWGKRRNADSIKSTMNTIVDPKRGELGLYYRFDGDVTDGVMDISMSGRRAVFTKPPTSVENSGAPINFASHSWMPGGETAKSIVVNVATNTIYSLTVKDYKGTPGSASLLVYPTQGPTIAAPAAVAKTNSPTSCAVWVSDADLGSATATDNCPGVTVKRTGVPAGNLFPVGVTTITYTATNAGGLTKTATQTVTVADTTKPTITCNAPISVNNDLGVCGARVNYTVTSSDNCTGQIVAQTAGLASGSVFPVGTTTNRFVVTDASGNTATCSFTVTVADTQKPTITCNAPISVNNDRGVCGARVSYTVTSSDNCTGQSVAQTAGLASGSVFPLGTTTNTFVVTDASRNAATCSFTVVVTDNEKPVLTCPGIQKFCSVSAGSYTIPMLTASDNCGIQTVAYAITGATTRSGTGYNASGAFAIGTSTIIWTVTDINGNVNTCNTTVVIWPLPVAGISASNADAFCNKLTLTTSSTLSGPFSFAWKYAGLPFASTKAIQLGNANGDGTYSVWATDGNGCTSASAATFVYQKQNYISNYTILGLKKAVVGENNTVNGSVGNMNAKGKIEIKKYATVSNPGAFVKGFNLDIDAGAIVPNRIYAPAVVTLPIMQYNTSSTTGLPNYTVAANTTVTLSGNYKDLNIKKGSTVTLYGSVFGKIDIEEGSYVKFTSPVVNISDIRVGKGPNNGYTRVAFAGNTSLRVSKRVDVEEDCIINPDGYNVTFYMGDTEKDKEKFTVKKGRNTTITANIYIPIGKLEIKKATAYESCTMTGTFIAEDVDGDSKYVTWNGYDCNVTAAPIARFAGKQKQSLAVALTPVDGLKVTAFPNPSPRHFTLLVQGKNNEPVSIRVIDIMGRLVEVRKGVSANGTLTLGASYGTGLYMAEVMQGKEKVVLKLIKQSK